MSLSIDGELSTDGGGTGHLRSNCGAKGGLFRIGFGGGSGGEYSGLEL